MPFVAFAGCHASKRQEPLHAVYTARLRAAGINTLTTLANTIAAQLQGIIQSRRWQCPAFAYWIRQAQRLNPKENLNAK